MLVCRQGSVEPYTLVDSPAAWYGRQYQDNIDEWAIQLSPQQITELEAAVAKVLANKTITQDGNYLNMVSAGWCCWRSMGVVAAMSCNIFSKCCINPSISLAKLYGIFCISI
jgi:hypothetical protein